MDPRKDPWKDVERGKEEDYFLRKHREWLEKKRGRSGGSAVSACPSCGSGLRETVIRNLPLRRCPDCGGAWLDAAAVATLVKTLGEGGE